MTRKWSEVRRTVTPERRVAIDAVKADMASPGVVCRDDDCLCSAWAAAEAALPDGYQLRGVWQWLDPYEGRYFRATADTGPGARHKEVQETGDTPKAALYALAETLRSALERGR